MTAMREAFEAADQHRRDRELVNSKAKVRRQSVLIRRLREAAEAVGLKSPDLLRVFTELDEEEGRE